MTNIYRVSSKGQFWNNYTSRGENVSRVLDWRFGGTILSGSFFITQGEASAKGRRMVILKTPGSKTHFAKNQCKSKNDGQVFQTCRKIYLPKYKKPYYQVVKLHVKMQYLWLQIILDHWGDYTIVGWVWTFWSDCTIVGQVQITQTMFNNRLPMLFALSLG